MWRSIFSSKLVVVYICLTIVGFSIGYTFSFITSEHSENGRKGVYPAAVPQTSEIILK